MLKEGKKIGIFFYGDQNLYEAVIESAQNTYRIANVKTVVDEYLFEEVEFHMLQSLDSTNRSIDGAYFPGFYKRADYIEILDVQNNTLEAEWSRARVGADTSPDGYTIRRSDGSTDYNVPGRRLRHLMRVGDAVEARIDGTCIWKKGKVLSKEKGSDSYVVRLEEGQSIYKDGVEVNTITTKAGSIFPLGRGFAKDELRGRQRRLSELKGIEGANRTTSKISDNDVANRLLDEAEAEAESNDRNRPESAGSDAASNGGVSNRRRGSKQNRPVRRASNSSSPMGSPDARRGGLDNNEAFLSPRLKDATGLRRLASQRKEKVEEVITGALTSDRVQAATKFRRADSERRDKGYRDSDKDSDINDEGNTTDNNYSNQDGSDEATAAITSNTPNDDYDNNNNTESVVDNVINEATTTISTINSILDREPSPDPPVPLPVVKPVIAAKSSPEPESKPQVKSEPEKKSRLATEPPSYPRGISGELSPRQKLEMRLQQRKNSINLDNDTVTNVKSELKKRVGPSSSSSSSSSPSRASSPKTTPAKPHSPTTIPIAPKTTPAKPHSPTTIPIAPAPVVPAFQSTKAVVTATADGPSLPFGPYNPPLSPTSMTLPNQLQLQTYTSLPPLSTQNQSQGFGFHQNGSNGMQYSNTITQSQSQPYSPSIHGMAFAPAPQEQPQPQVYDSPSPISSPMAVSMVGAGMTMNNMNNSINGLSHPMNMTKTMTNNPSMLAIREIMAGLLYELAVKDSISAFDAAAALVQQGAESWLDVLQLDLYLGLSINTFPSMNMNSMNIQMDSSLSPSSPQHQNNTFQRWLTKHGVKPIIAGKLIGYIRQQRMMEIQ